MKVKEKNILLGNCYLYQEQSITLMEYVYRQLSKRIDMELERSKCYNKNNKLIYSGYFDFNHTVFVGELYSSRLVQITEEDFLKLEWIQNHFYEIDILYLLSFLPKRIFYYNIGKISEGVPLVFEISSNLFILIAPRYFNEWDEPPWFKLPCFTILF